MDRDFREPKLPEEIFGKIEEFARIKTMSDEFKKIFGIYPGQLTQNSYSSLYRRIDILMFKEYLSKKDEKAGKEIKEIGMKEYIEKLHGPAAIHLIAALLNLSDEEWAAIVMIADKKIKKGEIYEN